jgi:hypothetical protein
MRSNQQHHFPAAIPKTSESSVTQSPLYDVSAADDKAVFVDTTSSSADDVFSFQAPVRVTHGSGHEGNPFPWLSISLASLQHHEPNENSKQH